MIFHLEYGDGRKQFPTLSSFVLDLLVLPHSTAAIEKLFSTVNLNKTEFRNRMENKTLTGLMHRKSLLRGKSAAELKMTRSHLARHKASMYNGQKEKQNDELINLDYASAILL